MKDEERAITKVGITGPGGRIGRTLIEGLADIVNTSQPIQKCLTPILI